MKKDISWKLLALPLDESVANLCITAYAQLCASHKSLSSRDKIDLLFICPRLGVSILAGQNKYFSAYYTKKTCYNTIQCKNMHEDKNLLVSPYWTSCNYQTKNDNISFSSFPAWRSALKGTAWCLQTSTVCGRQVCRWQLDSDRKVFSLLPGPGNLVNKMWLQLCKKFAFISSDSRKHAHVSGDLMYLECNETNWLNAKKNNRCNMLGQI